jgi:steroid 5-alpha reductase family enzyme
MHFFQIYLFALAAILTMMFVLWITSIIIKNVSIVDLFWGFGFLVVSFIYFLKTDDLEARKVVLLILVAIWGLRLSVYLSWRNIGKGEDYRYQKFRKYYGEHRYWWVSFFQTFLLQGILMWLISAPLLGALDFG